VKTYRCICGNRLHFENTQCLKCGRELGYIPEKQILSPLSETDNSRYQALCAGEDGAVYKKCFNYHTHHICNWMIPAGDPQELCIACGLNEIIPDLSKAQNIKLWFRLEQAKRRLIYELIALHLPLASRREDIVNGLSFRFMEDITALNPHNNEVVTYERITTGHKTGVITINLAEADPSAREEMREQMNERYRTLLGHFRHESGHFYWDQLIANTDSYTAFRAMFGDERSDYQQALQAYYDNGPPANWQANHISEYASAHPWEDWAETWAHYLHIMDTLETAHDLGFHTETETSEQALGQFSLNTAGNLVFESVADDWQDLAVALNAMNRSMGFDDPYPFALSHNVIVKLKFIHDLIAQHSATG
jgi:hypothetical protein